MNFWEGLCAFAGIIILGFYGLLILSAKLGLLDDEKKEDKPAEKKAKKVREEKEFDKDPEKFFKDVKKKAKKETK